MISDQSIKLFKNELKKINDKIKDFQEYAEEKKWFPSKETIEYGRKRWEEDGNNIKEKYYMELENARLKWREEKENHNLVYPFKYTIPEPYWPPPTFKLFIYDNCEKKYEFMCLKEILNKINSLAECIDTAKISKFEHFSEDFIDLTNLLKDFKTKFNKFYETLQDNY